VIYIVRRELQQPNRLLPVLRLDLERMRCRLGGPAQRSSCAEGRRVASATTLLGKLNRCTWPPIT
jgi:hypothetical protein